MKKETIRFDEKGLVPAIVQDAISKEVLTLAYMNKESLQKTQDTGETWFYSRSRQELWHKGATSGHTQSIIDIRFDCDADALLVLVESQALFRIVKRLCRKMVSRLWHSHVWKG